MTQSLKERELLRKLAHKYLEIAQLPIMKEREQLWYRHNACKAERPVIVMEMATFENDLLPKPMCESTYGRRMERYFQRAIINHEWINDDKVVSPYFELPLSISISLAGQAQNRTFIKDSRGVELGYVDEHLIDDLENDLPKLKHSICTYDQEDTNRYKQFVMDTVGDLMPIIESNHSLNWFCTPSQSIVQLMGMEAMMYAAIDSPDLLKALYDFIADDVLMVLEWQSQNGLLRMNNGNHFAGSGSYGFSHELPTGSPVRPIMLWGNMNSQETLGISPQMFHEFVFPAYEKIAKAFGLVYYGCCEPVHPIWEDIRSLPHLRKVSISPWCDEHFMGEALKNSGVIYSRKPSPNYLGVGIELDEDSYTKHIDETLRSAKGCSLEIIHRDIYTLSSKKDKAAQAVKIIRREIDKLW